MYERALKAKSKDLYDFNLYFEQTNVLEGICMITPKLKCLIKIGHIGTLSSLSPPLSATLSALVHGTWGFMFSCELHFLSFYTWRKWRPKTIDWGGIVNDAFMEESGPDLALIMVPLHCLYVFSFKSQKKKKSSSLMVLLNCFTWGCCRIKSEWNAYPLITEQL